MKKQSSLLDEVVTQNKESQGEKVDINDMPLESLRDYRLYNEACAKENKKLRICRYQMKPCPIELHPKVRVKFGRVDQPTNPLPVYLSDSVIHFEKTLIPGEIYDLPQYVATYLSEKGNPNWGWVDLPNGGRETRVLSKSPRFTLQTIYQEA